MNKQVRKYAKTFKRAAQHASVADIDTCVSSFEQRLSQMYATELFRSHNVYPTTDASYIYAIIAMCLELKERGLMDEEIREALNHAFAARRKFFDVLIRAIDLLPNCYSIVRRWNLSDHQKRVADGSITYDVFEVRDHSIEYDISHCMYVDMFQTWGIRSLCKVFCDTDVRAYGNLTRHVEFVRHSDLSTGDCCHDEIYERGYRA